MLTPGQIAAICGACARVDTVTGEWAGRVRDRLLWELLAETGLRLGEALSLQHRDWHTGRGDTPFIEVVPRDLPHGARVKGGRYRRVFISDDLDRLYGEYLWQLCDAGAGHGGAGPGPGAGVGEPRGRAQVRAVAAGKRL